MATQFVLCGNNLRIRRSTTGVSLLDYVLLNENVFLPAAGGNEYEIEAKDSKGNVVIAVFLYSRQPGRLATERQDRREQEQGMVADPGRVLEVRRHRA